jgi:eukaryotic-like serine/threonine-protein kinase
LQNYIGKHIDRYRVTERLGMGGMAVVYKAHDTRLDRDVALKLIRTESIPQDQHDRLLKRFEREAKAQARFTHPHIVPAYDYGEFEGTPYMVLAYLSGGTLKDRMCGVMPVPDALQLVKAIADAVAYAHSMGVLHRDIKPSNIIFSKDDIPRLTDFGIAKMLETADVTLTATGLGVGTPEYMAPEQWQGQAMEASDQYALGVVLYELLTGEKPYTAETPLAVALKVMHDQIRRPRDLNPAIPEGVEKLLYKALARHPQDRYVDIRTFGLALEEQLTLCLPVPEKEAKETRPAPAPQAEDLTSATKSEAETIDELAATPVEVEPQPSTHQKSISPQTIRPTKVALPAWVKWMGGLAIVILFITAGISVVGGGRDQQLEPTIAPTEAVISLVDIPVPTTTDNPAPTVAETPLLSPTATETPVPIPTLPPEPTLGIGSTMVNPVDGAVLVNVPEGEFLMGSEDEDAREDEKPEHPVWLDAFWIYQHPVTNAQFAAFVNASGHQTTAEESGWSWVLEGSSWVKTEGAYWGAPEGLGSSLTGRDDHPVVQVSWFDATAYCQWAGGRLPTEAEWEKAARGTDGRRFPWGDDPVTGDRANSCDVNCPLDWAATDQDDGYSQTSPVGSYPAGVSPYGALDMAGNVFEWVADWYDEEYYSRAPDENPTGPTSGEYRVLRGGSWLSFQWVLRVSNRYRYSPDFWYFFSGFRCLRRAAP